MFFHWTMLLLVVAVGTLGLLHDSWPNATQAFWINVRAVCGLVLWCVLLARIGWCPLLQLGGASREGEHPDQDDSGSGLVHVHEQPLDRQLDFSG